MILSYINPIQFPSHHRLGWLIFDRSGRPSFEASCALATAEAKLDFERQRRGDAEALVAFFDGGYMVDMYRYV